jgi:hypothetical protein
MLRSIDVERWLLRLAFEGSPVLISCFDFEAACAQSAAIRALPASLAQGVLAPSATSKSNSLPSPRLIPSFGPSYCNAHSTTRIFGFDFFLKKKI